DAQAIRTAFTKMQAMAHDDMARQGISAASVRFDMRADLKYAHQLSELIVSFETGGSDDEMRTRLTQQFTQAHQHAFGYVLRAEPIELVSVRLRAVALAGDVTFSDLIKRAPLAQSGADLGHRQAYFGADYGFVDTPIWRRGDISDVMRGPLI